MKKTILLLAMLAFSLGMSAQTNVGVKFDTTSTVSALIQRAQKNKKGPNKIFIDCYTSWCGPCRYMSKTIFPMKQVGDYMNADFICAKVDMEKGQGPELAKKYGVSAYPTFLILDANGNEINRFLGSSEADEFIATVKDACDESTSLAAIRRKYDESKSFDSAISYMKALKDKNMIDKMTSFVEEIIDSTSVYDLYSTQMWDYLRFSMDSDKVFDKVMDTKNEADYRLGSAKVNPMLVQTIERNLYLYTLGKKDLTKDQLNDQLNTLKLLGNDKDDYDIKFYKIVKAFSEGNYDAMAQQLDVRVLYSDYNKRMELESLVLDNPTAKYSDGAFATYITMGMKMGNNLVDRYKHYQDLTTRTK